MARRAGVEVEEFGIFFPPRLYTHKTKSGWLFTINLIPLGGFVRLKGEHDSDTAKGSYGAASLWDKSKIMAAGVVMNLITALVLFTGLALIGIPNLLPNQFTVKSDTKERVYTAEGGNYFNIDMVEAKSAAQKAGIKKGDQLLAIGPYGHAQALKNPDALPATTKHLAGQKISVEVRRDKKDITLTATLPTPDQLKVSGQPAYLGIETTPQFSQITLRRSTWSAPIVAVGFSAQATALTFQGLGHALAGLGSIIAGTATGNTAARQHGQTAASAQVGGPVAVYKILRADSALGYQFVLFIIALVSLTLAIMNILPIPALDGGRLWLTLIFRALKKPLSQRSEETISAIGMTVLILLMIAVTYVDIHRPF